MYPVPQDSGTFIIKECNRIASLLLVLQFNRVLSPINIVKVNGENAVDKRRDIGKSETTRVMIIFQFCYNDLLEIISNQ